MPNDQPALCLEVRDGVAHLKEVDEFSHTGINLMYHILPSELVFSSFV
jgi:hypothetical protein